MTHRKATVWAWVVLILALCWYPKTLMPVAEGVSRPIVFRHLDKVVHFGIFAVYGILASRAAREPGGGRRRVYLAIGLAVAALSELGQMMPIVNRDAGLDDLIADSLGVVVGLALPALGSGRVKAPSSGTP